MELTTDILNQVGKIVIEELAKSFEEEGHKLTGELIANITQEHEVTEDNFTIDHLIYKYGAYLQQGVSASRIPYDPSVRTGAKRSLYIEGLIKYVQMRMAIADLKEAKSVAFAIAATQKKRGMPIRTDGQGTKWIQKAVEKIDQRFDEMHFENLVMPDFNELIREWTIKLNE